MERKLNYEKIKELFEQDISCEKSSIILGYPVDSIYNAVRVMGLKRDYKLCENKPVKLTQLQREVLIGTMLGDASMTLKTKNAYVKMEQGEKQYEYMKWKHDIFHNLASPLVHVIRKNKDTRTNKIYSSYTFYLRSNPEFNSIYQLNYIDGKKRITKDLLKDYSALSLAVHIMDDGSKNNKAIILSTQCFPIEDVIMFKEFLFTKFGIISTINYNRGQPIIRTKFESFALVNFLVRDYIIESMKYKVS